MLLSRRSSFTSSNKPGSMMLALVTIVLPPAICSAGFDSGTYASGDLLKMATVLII